MNEYKYLELIDRLLENGEPFGLCLYYTPREQERRLCFDVRDCRLVVMSTVYDQDYTTTQYVEKINMDIEKILQSGMFLGMVDTVVDQFSKNADTVHPRGITFKYRNSPCRGGFNTYTTDSANGEVYGEFDDCDDEGMSDMTDICIYRRNKTHGVTNKRIRARDRQCERHEHRNII